jgi:hypothetical protein
MGRRQRDRSLQHFQPQVVLKHEFQACSSVHGNAAQEPKRGTYCRLGQVQLKGLWFHVFQLQPRACTTNMQRYVTGKKLDEEMHHHFVVCASLGEPDGWCPQDDEDFKQRRAWGSWQRAGQ